MPLPVHGTSGTESAAAALQTLHHHVAGDLSQQHRDRGLINGFTGGERTCNTHDECTGEQAGHPQQRVKPVDIDKVEAGEALAAAVEQACGVGRQASADRLCQCSLQRCQAHGECGLRR